MIDLKEIYDKLPLPKNQNSNSYSAEAITGYKNHRIAKNYADNPSLLIFISEQNQDFFIANQNLFSIKVSHNLKCEIESDKKLTYNNFSVVSYIGQNDDVKGIFLSTCQVLIKSLGQNPTNKKIKHTVGKFIELFKAIKETPSKSLQGLWAELFIIEQSNFPENLINGWHSIPEEKFDFSFGKLRLEVKSSATNERTHHFSSGQLNPIKDTEIIIASIFTNINAGGFSINDLLGRINNKINNFPRQKEKLHLLVYSTLGVDIDKMSQVKFDYELAKESLRYYHSVEIPKIQNKDIPTEINNVKFTSLLGNCKSINLNLDVLLKT
ncbi:PD-(D/E)XK motif protein [Formosa sp. PL04]|uniref:PD-(D/E)XK motif protein n=1 Tax=Formosa sp. PL04 TaxID=3081755 RepID=UPI00298215F4|nr:PD-(D/E)XK motif protein [Formosa sp. PL04]MDW5289275.1 PD-(D/E)XK motif protein [Formosa sp. PL04]